MHPRPTYDDANLILRLYELRRDTRLRQARAWFIATFKGVRTYDELMTIAPAGSEENASYRMVVSYWDMVSSFVASGILHRELFFQSGRELLVVWERVRDVLPSVREAYRDPGYLRNLETVGTEFAAYLKTHGEGAYDAFVTRIK